MTCDSVEAQISDSQNPNSQDRHVVRCAGPEELGGGLPGTCGP